jgi:hypothetical protein
MPTTEPTTDFDAKLSAWREKQRGPKPSKMNGVMGGPGAGKRMPPKEFAKLVDRIHAGFKGRARQHLEGADRPPMTAQEKQSRAQAIEAHLAQRRGA